MFTAAVVIWLNTIPLTSIGSPKNDPDIFYSLSDWGPWTHPSVSIDKAERVVLTNKRTNAYGWPFALAIRESTRSSNFEIQWKAAARNCIIGLAALALAGYVSEKIIRRKKSA